MKRSPSWPRAYPDAVLAPAGDRLGFRDPESLGPRLQRCHDAVIQAHAFCECMGFRSCRSQHRAPSAGRRSRSLSFCFEFPQSGRVNGPCGSRCRFKSGARTTYTERGWRGPSRTDGRSWGQSGRPMPDRQLLNAILTSPIFSHWGWRGFRLRLNQSTLEPRGGLGPCQRADRPPRPR
jgi:hypothetical protein